MLTKLTVEMTLQYTRISNHVVHLKLIHVICQLYLNKIGENNKVLSTIITVLCIRSLNGIHLTTESMYALYQSFPTSSIPQPLATATLPLFL